MLPLVNSNLDRDLVKVPCAEQVIDQEKLSEG
jgi:hypothetical protein